MFIVNNITMYYFALPHKSSELVWGWNSESEEVDAPNSHAVVVQRSRENRGQRVLKHHGA